jgi:hypothetical protein
LISDELIAWARSFQRTRGECGALQHLTDSGVVDDPNGEGAGDTAILGIRALPHGSEQHLKNDCRPRSTSLITTIPATQFSRADGKCFVPFQCGTRPFDVLFKLDAKRTGIETFRAFVDLASDPQKAPIVLDQSLGAPFF